MHRLPGDAVALGHFSNRRSGYDFHDRVIALLHDAQLHKHGPATLRREHDHDGACPSGRCQASDEATVSTISRSRTLAGPVVGEHFLYLFKGAPTVRRASRTTPPTFGRFTSPATPSQSDLDETFFHSHRNAQMSVRWVFVHLIGEYARHNGDADLLRERINGATGY